MIRKTFKIFVLFWVASIGFAQIDETKVIDVNPAIPSEPVKEGVCWDQSVVLPRFGAWSCVTANKENYDPCFSQENVTDAVVCDVNPVKNSLGLKLKLAQPLPFSQGMAALPDQAWIVELENHIICKVEAGPQKIIANTGTIAFVCDEPGLSAGVNAGLLSGFELGTVWQGHLVHYSVENENYVANTITQVYIKTVWR